MRLLKLPDTTYFTGVAYASPTSLLTLSSGSAGWVVRVWDLAGDATPVEVPDPGAVPAQLLFRAGGEGFLRAGGFWPDGASLPPSGGASRLRAALGAGVRQVGWRPFAFGPDGATVLYAHTGPVDGTYRTQFHLRTADGAIRAPWGAWGAFTTSADFSPNGRLVAMCNGLRVVVVWDVLEYRELFQLEQSDNVNSLAFTSDEQLVVAAGRSVRLWDVTSGRPLAKFRAFRKYADALAVSPDRALFAAGSRDGLVRVWDAASGRERGEYEWAVGHVRGLAFSPDGTTAAVAGMSAVAVWDLD